MEWFRHYHGLVTDPKLHRIARHAKVSRAIVIAAWCAILEHASEQSERGDVTGIEAGDLAYLIDQKPSVAERVMNAILASDLIANGRVAAWEKRQKISDDGKIRVQRHRAKNDKPLENNETDEPGNVTVTPLEQRREDKKESTNVDSKEPEPDGSAGGQAAADDSPAKPVHRKSRYPSAAKLPKNGKGPHYPDEFDALWRTFPTRREDTKLACYKHWRRWVVDHGVDPEEILAGAKRYAAANAGNDMRIGLRRWCDEGLWMQESCAEVRRHSVNPVFTL